MALLPTIAVCAIVALFAGLLGFWLGVRLCQREAMILERKFRDTLALVDLYEAAVMRQAKIPSKSPCQHRHTSVHHSGVIKP